MFLFYASNITPRLEYIIDFFGHQLFDSSIRITTNIEEFKHADLPKLNYSKEEISSDEFFLKPTGLLYEAGIKQQKIDCFEINFQKAFFETSGDLHFDIFAASFFLITRYEEYLPHEKDEFGRYAHTNSLAFKEKFLQLPLVNIWLQQFKKALLQKFPKLIFKQKQFKCIISYDIDIAYSYLYKGLLRNTGGLVKSMVNGKWHSAKERLSVLLKNKKDPYDCYEWLDALHLYCRLKPYYFFLVAKNRSKYDKNISTNQRAFYELIRYYSKTYKIGLHPSWQSGDDHSLLREELEWLETVADKKIVSSRQHYIRFTLPGSYNRLLASGINKDFSMGYGSINGFRASVCSSFYWYDLIKEEKTNLKLYPFCFMDANSFFEQKQSPAQTYQELIGYYELVKKVNGMFISVWHNNILGTDREKKGWREMFELFMKETVYWDAHFSGS